MADTTKTTKGTNEMYCRIRLDGGHKTIPQLGRPILPVSKSPAFVSPSGGPLSL